MKKASIFLILTGVLLFLGYWFYPQTPEEKAFNEFLTTQHKESWIVAPLCSAGEKVVPLVLQKIQNRYMERRVYAIGFLGSGEYQQAIPVLEKLANDKYEKVSIRANSLEAIFLIKESKGRELAGKYKNNTDYLGEMANKILSVEDYREFKEKQYDVCNITD